MSTYSNEELSGVIMITADSLKTLASGLDKQNEALKLIVLSLEVMNKKLNNIENKTTNPGDI